MLARFILLTDQDDVFRCAHSIDATTVPAFLQSYVAAPAAVPTPMSIREPNTFSVFPRAAVIDLVARRRCHTPCPDMRRGGGNAVVSSCMVYTAHREDVQCVESSAYPPSNGITSCYFYDE